LQIARKAVAETATGARHIRVQLLGCTRQLADMDWPEGTFLLAADSAHAVVRNVWPGDRPGRRHAVRANWFALPQADASCDVVIGDGSLNSLSYPDGFRALGAEVRRVLKPGGIFVIRCFALPAVPEPAEAIFDDMVRGSIPSFHHCKFRLLMALQRDTREGIAVHRVFEHWRDRTPDVKLPSGPGWEEGDVATINLYRGTSTVYAFPARREFEAVLYEDFDPIRVLEPSYHLGDRCPIFLLRPSARQA
jgi:SAM-dependent methyltransferase